MDYSTKLTTLVSLIIAASLVAGLTINAPQYISGTQLENGLITQIQFNNPTYQTLDVVEATYEFYNPLKTPVTFTPPTTLSIESGYVDEPKNRQTEAGYLPDSITINQGETFSTKVSIDLVLSPGTFSVDVNGTSGTVEIVQGPLEARVSMDREVYVVGEGSGTATLEIYNSGSAPLTYRKGLLSPLKFHCWYLGEDPSDFRHERMVSWVDRVATVQPGETQVVESESFPIPKSGTLILDFNGVRRSLTILPD